MNNDNEKIILSRDCDATLIPFGNAFTLKKGDEVKITQALGGSYTIMAMVDLGLIYSCELINEKSGGTNIEIKMTLTAPGCGMGPMLVDEVKAKVSGVKNVKEVNVELVWEPQWSQDMMSESAKLDTGMY